MDNILEFHDIYRTFEPGKPVLDSVSFSLQQSEVVGLLGRNGAGKTTLMRIALGVLMAQRGNVRVFGLSPVDEAVAVKRRIGFVAEDQVFPPKSSVGGLIAFHRYLFPTWDDSFSSKLLDRFGLSPRSKISRLSKGEARKVALLCAVCHRPELLLLDEPASGLDPVARREFLEIAIRLLNREGSTILFSSHYMNDVERIGGRIVLLDQGMVRIDSELDRVREGYCLALVPESVAPERPSFERLAGFIQARQVGNEWHVIFEASTEQTHENLASISRTRGIRCARLPLEELFVELTREGR